MATAWQTYPIEFKGGLRSDLGILQQGIQQPGSATYLQNFEPSKEGGYRKISGYDYWDEAEVPGVGPILGVAILNSTTMVAVRGQEPSGISYFKSQGSGWTLLGSYAMNTSRLRSISFKFNDDHKLLFVDGANSPVILNDTTDTLSDLSAVTDLLGSTSVEIFKQHVFIANGSNLYFSAPYAETDWTPGSGAGVINAGHTITALKVFRDELFIFARNKIQRLTGSSLSDFALSPVAEDIGCIDQETVQEIGGDVVFLAPDGFRLLSATDRNNDFALDILSDRIPREYEKFLLGGTFFTSVVCRSKAQYRVFSYSQALQEENSLGLLFTKFSDQGGSSIEWATTLGLKVRCVDSRYTSIGEIAIFGNDTGFVYRMESGRTFNGAPIESIYRSPDIPIDDPKIRKTLYRMVLYTDTTGTIDIKVNIRYDLPKVTNYNKVSAPTVSLGFASGGIYIYGTPDAVYGVATYGANLDKVFETPVIGSGKTFQLEIRDNSTNPAFTLDTAVFDYLSHDKQ